MLNKRLHSTIKAAPNLLDQLHCHSTIFENSTDEILGAEPNFWDPLNETSLIHSLGFVMLKYFNSSKFMKKIFQNAVK